MATTTPLRFSGTPKAPLEFVSDLYSLYVTALGDEDKAGDVEDCLFWEGQRTAYEQVLRMLHDDEPVTAEWFDRHAWVYPGVSIAPDAPATSRAETREAALAVVEDEALDDAVHDCASQIASNTNNGGRSDQIEFLRSNGWSVLDIISYAKGDTEG